MIPDFSWVDGDMAEVQVQLSNPMPDDLAIAQLGLITEGLKIETFPCTPSIPAEYSSYQVNIRLRPESSGDLKILGEWEEIDLALNKVVANMQGLLLAKKFETVISSSKKCLKVELLGLISVIAKTKLFFSELVNSGWDIPDISILAIEQYVREITD